MNLRTLFAIPIAVVLLVTVSLAGMMAGQGWSGLARGQAAVEAVDRMRLLLRLQSDLRAERVTSNLALAQENPLPEPIARRLAATRRDTDRDINAVITRLRDRADLDLNAMPPRTHVMEVLVRLGSVRGSIDGLLAQDRSERSFAELATIMPRALEVAKTLDVPVDRASLAVVATDPGLAGLVTEDRLAASLRDQVALIAGVLLPRSGKAEMPTGADLDNVRTLLAQAARLTRLIEDSIEIAGATPAIRMALASISATDLNGILRQLTASGETPTGAAQDDSLALMPQRVLVPWGMRISALRDVMLDSMVERVSISRVVSERQFDFVLAGFGVVVVAILESVASLSQSVVNPLAQLGLAITRIAAGDRSVPLAMRSGTREINEMVTAVETLRQAALIADAAALRQRMVARQRLELLRQALGIARSVQEPARALERGVASLSEGIDATIALIHAEAAVTPATLEVAADAVRIGLAEMRESAAGLDATFAAASEDQTEERPVAEFVTHILAVQAEVDRREQAVRRFVQSSLVALRDAESTAGERSMPVLHLSLIHI